MKTREELLKDINFVRFINSDGEYTRQNLCEKDVLRVLSAPTKAQMECPYCHEPFRNLASFRVKNGRQEAYNLSVPSFDGLSNGSLEYDRVHAYQPYGDFRKINFCPICGRKLGDD